VAYGGNPSSRLSDSAVSTLPLLAYLALSVVLMIADHKAGYGQIVRQRFSLVSEPFWWLASSPVRGYEAARDNLRFSAALRDDNNRLQKALEITQARLHRLSAVAEENLRLRQLLGGTRGYRLNVQMVQIVDIDLDPYRQRIVLDAGSDSGVRIGQALIDSGGVLGQVIEVGKHRAIALLLTDIDHAVPVQVARSGLRTVAYGVGRTDRVDLPNIPQSADIRTGDLLVTSGIGGRFPAGFPVGTVTALHPDNTRLFIVAEAKPAAHLDNGAEVLLVSNLPAETDIGPANPHPNAAPKPVGKTEESRP
jgi:rod shape-determining protein MreC